MCFRLAMLVGLTLAASSCGSPQMPVGTAPSAAQATGRSSVLAVSGSTTPFVVDWLGEQRGDLEEAMRDGVAVVAFDENSLRLVKNCRVEGKYGYIGLITKYQVVRFESENEVQANLPLAGVSLVARLGASFQQGATLDLAMAMVGKKRTTWRQVTRHDLVGDCAQATHFVRGATVGAFVVEPGQHSEAKAAAEILAFGASYQGSNKNRSQTSDGQLEACKLAMPDNTAPPPQCAALIRLELEPIALEAKLAAGNDAPSTTAGQAQAAKPIECPEGMVFTGEKCAAKENATSHVCRFGDAEDCVGQCKLGNALSCDNIGVMLAQGTGVAADANAAAGAFQRGCEAGAANACVNLGVLKARDNAVDATRLFQAACTAAHAGGCRLAADMLYLGQGIEPDHPSALKYYQLACEGGDYLGCTNVGFLYGGGSKDIAKDERRGIDYTARACDGGVSAACGNLGLKYEFGVIVSKDPKRAVALFDRACRMNDSDCLRLAIAYQSGFGVNRSDRSARELYRRACSSARYQEGSASFGFLSCLLLNIVYREPLSDSAEFRPAMEGLRAMMVPQCAQDIPRACTFEGLAQLALGRDASGWTLVETGCAMHDYFACDLKKRLTRH